MPIWPATLPVAPLLDGFRETPPNTALRTEMEQGPAKLRRRTTAGVRKFAVQYLLDETQLAILETFYLTTLQGGTLAFDFMHPRNSATISCRFARPPEYGSGNGIFFRVSCELEVLP